MKKPILIIQGPLISNGIEGAKAHINIKNLNKDDEVSWDCRQNIIDIIEDYGDMFERIIISIWKSCPRFQLEYENVDVIRNPDLNDIENLVFGLDGSRGINNSHRQFFSVLSATENLNDNDFVVKIRTDQNMDLNCLIKYLKCQKTLQNIYFPSSNLFDYISDYYIAGKVFAIKKIFQGAFNNFYHPNPHFNIETSTCVYLGLNADSFPNLIDASFDVDWYERDKVASFFMTKFNRGYGLLPRSVFLSVIWRGSQISRDYADSTKELVFGDNNLLYKNLLSCLFFLPARNKSLIVAKFAKLHQMLRDFSNVK